MIRPLLNQCPFLREARNLDVIRDIALLELCSLTIVEKEIIKAFYLGLVLENSHFFVEFVQQESAVLDDRAIVRGFKWQ